MRVWSNWNFHTLLTGMQNGKTTEENSVAISYDVKHTFRMTQQSPSQCLS